MYYVVLNHESKLVIRVHIFAGDIVTIGLHKNTYNIWVNEKTHSHVKTKNIVK